MQITQQLVGALNYLSCGIEKHRRELESEFMEILWRSHSYPTGVPPPLDRETARAAQHVPGYLDFHLSLSGIQEAVGKAEGSLDSLVENLERACTNAYEELRSAEEEEEAYQLAQRLRHAHSYFHLFRDYLDVLGEQVQTVAQEENPEPFSRIAASLRDELLDVVDAITRLIRAKDGCYQYRRLRVEAAEKRGRPSTEAVHPTPSDYQRLRTDLLKTTEESLDALNPYLEKQHINYLLVVGRIEISGERGAANRYKSSPLLIPELAWRSPRPGRAPTGLFAELLQPFIDYVLDPKPPVKLGVCEKPPCSCVFIRHAKGGKRRYCERCSCSR